jgi:YbbR domain-containing protein
MIGYLTENIGAKLLSVAVAVGLWMALVGEQDLSTAIEVPVEYRNFPKGLEVSQGMVTRANLLVRAPSGKLDDSVLKESSVMVDLKDVSKPGERTFNLDGKAVSLPAGLVLERATPAQIRMRFEVRVARDVPVRLRYEGAPMEGYRVAKQEIVPDRMRIVGPKSRVQAVQYVETDPVELTGVTRELETGMNTFVDDPQVRIDGDSHVRVRVVLERAGGQ